MDIEIKGSHICSPPFSSTEACRDTRTLGYAEPRLPFRIGSDCSHVEISPCRMRNTHKHVVRFSLWTLQPSCCLDRTRMGQCNLVGWLNLCRRGAIAGNSAGSWRGAFHSKGASQTRTGRGSSCKYQRSKMLNVWLARKC